MGNSAWKKHERKTAKLLGGARIPCSGNGAIQGDVLHDRFFIECKYKKAFSVLSLFRKVKAQSPKDKVPLLVLKQKFKKGELVVMDLADFLKLVNAEVEDDGTDKSTD